MKAPTSTSLEQMEVPTPGSHSQSFLGLSLRHLSRGDHWRGSSPGLSVPQLPLSRPHYPPVPKASNAGIFHLSLPPGLLHLYLPGLFSSTLADPPSSISQLHFSLSLCSPPQFSFDFGNLEVQLLSHLCCCSSSPYRLPFQDEARGGSGGSPEWDPWPLSTPSPCSGRTAPTCSLSPSQP